MRSFNDKNGTSWDIEVSTMARAVVSSRTGIDLILLGQGDKHTFDLLLQPQTTMDVLLAITEKQRQLRNISADDFGSALNSVELADAALEAIINATFDFFPKAQSDLLRKTLLTTLEIHREDEAEAMAKALEIVNAPDFKEKLRAKLKEKSTDSPESSASTPDRSVGDS